MTMKNICLSPEALNDLEILKGYLSDNYGGQKSEKVLRSIMSDLKSLAKYPNSGSQDMFKKFNIETDYAYLVTHKNYAFYRIEDDSVRIIRILDTRRDVIYTLFGIKVVDHYNEYWNE